MKEVEERDLASLITVRRSLCEGQHPLLFQVHLAIEARISCIVNDITRDKGFGEYLAEFGGCDPQIGAICFDHYR